MNRKLWENLASLYSVQVFTYIVPLLTLPYLSRVLGPTGWGALAFAEAYAAYITLVVEFGFSLSASREIAQARSERDTRTEIVSGVIGAQIVLTIVCLISTIVVAFLPTFTSYRPFLPIAFLLALARAFYPYWYFQGLERMRLVCALTVLSNLVAAGCTLLLVRGPTDNLLPLYIRTATSTLALVPALFIMIKETSPPVPSMRTSLNAIKAGWSLFLSRGAISLYTTANILILGALAPAAAVAWFAGAEKLTRAATGAIGPITQSFYPRLSFLVKHRPDDVAKTAMLSVWLTTVSGLAIGIVLYAAAPFLVRILLGPSFGPSVDVLRILAFVPPLVAGSNFLGVQWMYSLRMDKEVNAAVLLGGLLNLGLSLGFANQYRQVGMASSVALTELAVTGAMLTVLVWQKRGPWNKNWSVKESASS